MKKQILILFVIGILLFVGLCGCTNSVSDKNKFVGVWTGTYNYLIATNLSMSITFLSDGTYSARFFAGLESGTWDIKDGKLVKTVGSDPSLVYTYSFFNNDKSVFLSSTTQNEQWSLTKQ
jgi:hypothetical protein